MEPCIPMSYILQSVHYIYTKICTMMSCMPNLIHILYIRICHPALQIFHTSFYNVLTLISYSVYPSIVSNPAKISNTMVSYICKKKKKSVYPSIPHSPILQIFYISHYNTYRILQIFYMSCYRTYPILSVSHTSCALHPNTTNIFYIPVSYFVLPIFYTSCYTYPILPVFYTF